MRPFKPSSKPKVPEKEDFGDFEEVKEGTSEVVVQEEFSSRARMPREGEKIGIIVQRLGGNRMEVRDTEGKTRNCRVPGRYKRSLWLRPKDIVMIEPWADDDDKGDVVYKYSGGAINHLRKIGIYQKLEGGF